MTDRILGTTDDDFIEGTPDNETFQTLTGNDTVNGGAGDDIIITNEGNDVLLGGDGDDELYGCEDDDILDGGAGADFLNGGTGNDLLIFTAAENNSAAADIYDGYTGEDTLRLNLTAAEFQAAQADLAAFQDYIDATTVGAETGKKPDTSVLSAESNGSFFFFRSLNLFVRRVEFLQVVVDGEFVIGEPETVELVDDSADVSADEAVTGSVAENDDVPDGTTYGLLEAPSDGVLVLAEDGSFTFDPGDDFVALAEGETQIVTFTYEITTPGGTRSQAQGLITVTGVNDAPILAEPTTLEFAESDEETALDVLQGASDPEGDPLEVVNFRIVTDTMNADTGEAAGVSAVAEVVATSAFRIVDNDLVFDPSFYAGALEEGDVRTIVVEVDVSDGNGGISTRTLTLIVNGESDNRAPVVTEPAGRDFQEDETDSGDPLTFDLTFGVSDPDGDPLTVTNIATTYSGGDAPTFSLGADGRTLTLDATQENLQSLSAGQQETLELTYDVSDGQGGTVQQTAFFTITGVNDNPEAGGDLVFTANESDAEFSIDGLAPQPGVLGSSDVDGDTLSFDGYTLISGDDSGFISSLDFIGVDPTAYTDLAAGETEVIVIEIEVSDGNGGTDTRRATITIVGEDDANNAPVANTDAGGDFSEDDTDSGSPLTFDLTDGVTDADGDALTVSSLTATYTGGLAPAFTLGADGRTLTIDATQADFQSLAVGEQETLELLYDVSDGRGGVVEQRAVFTITGVNDNPDAGDDLTFTVTESDGPLDINGLLGATDIDDGDMLFFDGYTLVSGDDRGIISSLDFIELDPTAYSDLNAGETEVIVIQIEVQDGNGGSDIRLATITVEGEDDVPTDPPGNFTDGVTLFQFSTTEGAGTLVSGRLSDVITGPNGEPVVFDSYVVPAFAGLTYDEGSQTFVFDPADPAYDGLRQGEVIEVFTVAQVSDGNQGLTDVELRFEIAGVNDIPVIDGPLDATAIAGTSIQTFDLLEGASDADVGDVLFVSNVQGLVSGLELDARNGTLTIDTLSPAFDFIPEGGVEVYTIIYDVTDSFGAVTEQTLTLTVQGQNDAPVISSELDFTIQADVEGATEGNDNLRRQIDLLAAVSDPDGDEVAIVDFRIDGVTDEVVYDVDFETGILTIDYNGFSATALEPVTLFYTVEDTNGAQTEFDASINVIGVTDNVAPVSAGTLILELSPDTATTADLFANLSDENGDALSIEQIIGLDSVFVDFGTGLFDAGPILDSLADGESLDLFFVLMVGDGRGGSVTQDVAITLTGQNDAPSAGSLQTEYTLTEDDGIVLIDLLAGITDANGDTLTVTSVSSGTLLDDRYLRVDTNDFSALTTGDEDVQTITVTLTDGFEPQTYELNVTVQGIDDLPVITRTARFFDNDVAGYQTTGGQQNFVIRANELFDDGDNSDPLAGSDDRFTSVSVASGFAIGATVNADGEIVFDPAGLADLLAYGERTDILIDWEGVTGDGNVISGQFTYRIEGTSATDVNVANQNPKGDRIFREPGRDDDDVAHLMSEQYDPIFEPEGPGEAYETLSQLDMDLLRDFISAGEPRSGGPEDPAAFVPLDMYLGFAAIWYTIEDYQTEGGL